jgi:nucleotide-binding universal stress UspA family protein
VPVLVTPARDTGPLFVEDVRRIVPRVLAPVDLSAATARQVEVACGLAQALDVPLLLTHVIEPVRFPVPAHTHLPSVDSERRARADAALEQLLATIPSRLKPEGLVVYGDPAEEIAKVALERHVGMIVMGLHASPVVGPRMGSVTYRVLCLTHTLVLALPPSSAEAARRVRLPAAEQATHDSILANT